MLPFNVHHSLSKTAVITEDGVNVTYGDINDFSESVKKVIQHRCLVFCLCQNTIGALCGYLSFLSNKIVPVMLESKIDGELLAGLIKIYKPQYLWLPDHRITEFLQYKIVFSSHHYSLVKLDGNDDFPLHNDLAMLLSTSGSTGSSKFVRISYENIEANASSIADYLSIDENERPVTTLPMSYSYGLSVINSHILKGATLLLTSRTLMEKDFWTFLKARKATSLSGVPYTYKILHKLQFSRMDLPSLKTLTQAGGKLNEELIREIAEFCFHSGKLFFVMYGQTEATARMSFLPPQYALMKPGSIGKAIPGGEFSLIDDKGTDIIENDRVGELVYKGRNVSMGYATCGDDLEKGDENQGILFTGDLAKRDREDFYYIVGRKRRFIKIFGNRINLDETENLLENIISDCACTGEDDHMVIYINDKTRMAEIKKYLSSKTGLNQAVITVRYCAEIPKNSAGKTIYSKLDIS
ncbi:MAG: AMP-binding protein [Bacteroidetes bacterium]|nr:AMP-binding protein [Bacteroidota bacterium]